MDRVCTYCEEENDYVRLCAKYGEKVQYIKSCDGDVPDCEGSHYIKLKRRETEGK